ncbi:GNAT family N-acetyltransferase [Streptomyces sp. NRRL B-24484]|uniref:GNAT family N-acetyltransferase n=1 Tax=Streptomyces sp. NRRL B-24484 TaxID=1463833 RepID=UPI0004C26BF0|nr:GNAT family N-acetyltransferase [Streptomyces sp. NRRL B-24484]
MPHEPLLLQHHTPDSAKQLIDDLVAVYAEVYDVPPYAGDPFFAVETYEERLLAAIEMDGFETVTATAPDGTILGYVHGVTLPADRAWWVSLGDRRPDGILGAATAGDVFWLRELMVRPAHTNQGLGRRLHDEIIAGRGQSWTTLTCIIDNQPVHDAYVRWGYEIIGRIKHAEESPVYDAMILPNS